MSFDLSICCSSSRHNYKKAVSFVQVLFGLFGLPLGLGLIIICGAELYTTNAAWLPAAFYEGRANLSQVCKSWFFSFFGNLCGSLVVVWLLDEVRLMRRLL